MKNIHSNKLDLQLENTKEIIWILKIFTLLHYYNSLYVEQPALWVQPGLNNNLCSEVMLLASKPNKWSHGIQNRLGIIVD